MADEDGDYPVRFGSTLKYVRLVGDGQPDVQVFAVAVDGVSSTPELLADINDINTRATQRPWSSVSASRMW